jgi:hypothetical protein
MDVFIVLAFQLGQGIYSVYVYVFNRGQRNWILVVADNESSDSRLKKNALIRDCSTGRKGNLGSKRNFGQQKHQDKLKELREITSLTAWITHSHTDHHRLLVNGAFRKEKSEWNILLRGLAEVKCRVSVIDPDSRDGEKCGPKQ